MAPEDVQWGPAVAVLVLGLVLGASLVLRVRRRGSRPSLAPGDAAPALRDLDSRVEVLLQQLRELEDTSAKRTPEQIARERYALELEAARALLAREALAPKAVSGQASGPPTATAVGEPRGFFAQRPALKGFLWGAGSVTVLLALAGLAWRGTQPRQEAASPQLPADEARLRAVLARNPGDVDARMDLARSLLLRQDLMGVWNETQYVLTRTPGQPRALAYQALVRLAMGQGDLAVDMLKRAREAAPDLVEAYQHLAYVYATLGRTAEEEATIAEAEKRFPGIGEGLRSALAQVQSERGSPESAADQSARDAVAAAGSVSGVIEAAASTRARMAPGTVVFLTVREAGVEQGPPVAAKRLVAAGFPLQFFVGPADSMMGQPLPERMRIEARADADGDPATRSASDPQARLDGVAAGATGLRLALR